MFCCNYFIILPTQHQSNPKHHQSNLKLPYLLGPFIQVNADVPLGHFHAGMIKPDHQEGNVIGLLIVMIAKGLVNTFSDSLLSRDFEGRIVVTVEPFNWREIIKVLLDAGGIVKAVDEGENALRRFLPGAEPADGVYQLLLED